MAVPLSRTAEGFELQFGTNHLGHFALTNLLLPHLTDRVVSVSSSAHRMGHIDLTDLNWERRPYKQWPAYGQSKLANLLFVLELERRLTAAGSNVRALAAHPGFARTNLQGHSGNAWADRATMMVTKVVGQSADPGCLADPVRRDPGPARRLVRGSRRLRRGARTPAAGRPHPRGQRSRAGQAAVDRVGGPDRDQLPALRETRLSRRSRPRVARRVARERRVSVTAAT